MHGHPLSATSRYLVLAMFCLVLAMMVVNLQYGATWTGAGSGQQFDQYMARDKQLGSASLARPLVRWVILLGKSCVPESMKAQQVNFWLQVAFCWAALGMIALSTRRFLPFPWAFGAVLLCAAWLMWSFTWLGYRLSYPYDLPALFFSAAGLVAILYRRPAVLLLLILVGTANKETMLWLIPAWIAHEMVERRSARHILGWGLGLFAGFLLTYEAIRLFGYLPTRLASRRVLTLSLGDPPRLLLNLDELLLLNIGSLSLNVYYPLSLHIAAAAAIRRLPPTVASLYVGAVVLVTALFLVGNIWEVRIFNELLPLTVLAICIAAERLLAAPAALRDEKPGPDAKSDSSHAFGCEPPID